MGRTGPADKGAGRLKDQGVNVNIREIMILLSTRFLFPSIGYLIKVLSKLNLIRLPLT